MDQSGEVEQPREDSSYEGEVSHQDGILGPQNRALGVFVHPSYDGKEEWNVFFSIGMATNQEKAPLVQEIAAAGTSQIPNTLSTWKIWSFGLITSSQGCADAGSTMATIQMKTLNQMSL